MRLRPPRGRLDCILLKISYACFTYIIQHHLTLNSIKFKRKIQKNVKRLCIMPCPQTFDAYLPCLNSFYDLETRPLALWLVIRFVRYKRVLSSTRKSLGTNVKFSRFISCVNTLHLLDCGPHSFKLCRIGLIKPSCFIRISIRRHPIGLGYCLPLVGQTGQVIH